MSRKKRRKPFTKKQRHRLEPIKRCLHDKVSYKTSHRAEKERQRIITFFKVPYLRVYRCPDCRYFHLTSKRPREYGTMATRKRRIERRAVDKKGHEPGPLLQM